MLRLNRVVKTDFRIIGRELPSLEILYQQCLLDLCLSCECVQKTKNM